MLVVLAGGMILPAEEGAAHAARNNVEPGRGLEGLVKGSDPFYYFYPRLSISHFERTRE